jgi:hypothetical protein
MTAITILPLLLFVFIAAAVLFMRRAPRRDVPIGLRMIMRGCFIGVLFIPLALIPAGGHWINGEAVSFTEFWRRGGGPMFIVVGILLPLIGCGIAARKDWSRYAFIGFLLLTLGFSTIAQPHWDELISVLFIAFIIWYLFWRHTVREYFAVDEQ